MTPQAFARFTDRNGRNSYQRLAEYARGRSGQTILDLACGNGHLYPYLERCMEHDFRYIGIDLSESELSAARTVIGAKRNVSLINGRAQNLPLEDNEIDLILCHMSFVLMNPVEEVVNCMARCLKPGGKFVALVGAQSQGKTAVGTLQQCTGRSLHGSVEGLNRLPTGNFHTYRTNGIEKLFPKSSWKPPIIDDYIVGHSCPTKDIWSLFKNMYLVDLLDEVETNKLRSEFTTSAQSLECNGAVFLEHRLSLLQCQLRPR